MKQQSTLLLALAVLSFAATGCKTCTIGQEITIPSSDPSDPTVVMDFHLPNGTTVTVTPTSGPTTVNVPGGGKVTVIVAAEDPEGAKDAQIFAASIVTTSNPNGTATTSGPGLLGGPTANNNNSAGVGKAGCTKRIAQQDLTVTRSATRTTSFEVTAKAVNFGGRTVSTPLVRLNAQ